MKWIEVTAWGNNKKHLIPLNKIVDFNFKEKFTTISFTSGSILNIVENEESIKSMLSYLNAQIVSEQFINEYMEVHSAWREMEADNYMNDFDGDELPF